MYQNKKILIIGGTGTLGRHLVKSLLLEAPDVIRILSRDEHKQFEMQEQLREYANIRYLIGDVRDLQRLVRSMEDVDYVFHLAAMKHVPACEYNPFETVQTNVIGTQNVIQAALQSGVKKVLFTSTDKAISPTNTYGASKLMAERLISAAEFQKGSKETIFSSVRLGNVMGSRGSVIPLFKEQIFARGYITVTDCDMSRYMMTPSQATQLMLKANSLSYGGEVFVLKMPVIRLKDLAEVVIQEVKDKYNVSASIEIKEIGLRPGEKMFEELMTADEARVALERSDMFIIPSQFSSKVNRYPDVKVGTNYCYSSKYETPISKDTLHEWIRTEELT